MRISDWSSDVCSSDLVASNQRFGLRAEAEDMLAKFERRGCATLAFTHDHARIANEAEPLYGSGNGNGGPLNLLDLMVYAVARERSEEHTSELQSLMRISYAVFCLTNKHSVI